MKPSRLVPTNTEACTLELLVLPPNGSRLSCGALKKDSFPNLRAPAASSACYAAPTSSASLTSDLRRCPATYDRINQIRPVAAIDTRIAAGMGTNGARRYADKYGDTMYKARVRSTRTVT